MPGWQTQSSEIVYETAWFKVRRDQVTNHLGELLTYSYMELQNPSVFVVATNDKQEVLLQKVYRYPLKKQLIEIPAGYRDAGEEPIEAAKRELMEEAGMASANWHHLGTQYQIAGSGNIPIDAFLAENVQKVGDNTDKDEDIAETRFVSMQQFESMVMDNEIVDAPVIAAYFKAKLYLAKKKEQ